MSAMAAGHHRALVDDLDFAARAAVAGVAAEVEGHASVDDAALAEELVGRDAADGVGPQRRDAGDGHAGAAGLVVLHQGRDVHGAGAGAEELVAGGGVGERDVFAGGAEAGAISRGDEVAGALAGAFVERDRDRHRHAVFGHQRPARRGGVVAGDDDVGGDDGARDEVVDRGHWEHVGATGRADRHRDRRIAVGGGAFLDAATEAARHHCHREGGAQGAQAQPGGATRCGPSTEP